MKRAYYNSLNTDYRTELVWNYGEIVTTADKGDSYVLLFLLDNFYVEICVDKAKAELRYTVIQDDLERLYEYVKDLDIDTLVC